MNLNEIDWKSLILFVLVIAAIFFPAMYLWIETTPTSYNSVLNGDFTHTYNCGSLADPIYTANDSEFKTILNSIPEFHTNFS